MREMISPPSQNTAGVFNQITLSIFYSISSSHWCPYTSLIFLVVRVVSSLSILAFRYAFFFFLKCLLASRLTLFRLRVSTLFWLGSCIHWILACFLWSKIRKHSSWNHGLCCFNSCRPRLSLPVVLIFYLVLSQVIFMSPSSLKFSKAVKPVCNINLIMFPIFQLI
jgi:hypothetical protein